MKDSIAFDFDGVLADTDEFKRQWFFNNTGLILKNTSKTNKENYYSYGYIFITDLKENEFKLQKEEVNAVKYFTIEELEEIKKQNDIDYTFCNWDEEGFKKQMDILKEYRNKLEENNE